METAEIRRRWLSFFEKNGHIVVPSAPLIYDDPNLLFVNAGMVQFKPYFLGQETPPFHRATSVQKCVRTGDIDEVGKTSRHGTFFQMNGNFSFGDYFKDGAIRLAWELLTTPQDRGGYGLEGERLWATVYEDDDEAARLWLELTGIPEERIVRRGKADNYWSMGVPGPGGPCSEIYYDRGPEYGAEGGPAVDEDRFLEVWNLVFMQHELSAVRSKSDFDIAGELPKKNIDTGMGLERMAAILQGVDNMYEIDEIYPVLAKAAEMTGRTYGEHSGHAAGTSHPDDVRLRVVADHVRSALMLIGDGVTPGNEGRGYVLRRMLRRVIRSMRLLGFDDPALPHLLPVSLERMQRSYPELERDFGRIGADRVCRGGRLPAHPGRRDDDPRHGCRPDEGVRCLGPRRRRGVRAPRHLRVPHRPHPRDGGRAGRLRRRGRLPPPHDRAATAGEGRRPGQEGGPRRHDRLPAGGRRARPRGRVHRLRRGRERGPGRRHHRRWGAGRLGRDRRRHRARPRPDPLLRRGRRPARRRGAAPAGERRHRPGPRRAEAHHRAHRPPGDRRRRGGDGGSRPTPRSTSTGAGPSPAPTRRRTWSTRPSARRSGRPRPRRGRRTPRAGSGSTSTPRRPSRRRSSGTSRRGSTPSSSTTSRSAPT